MKVDKGEHRVHRSGPIFHTRKDADVQIGFACSALLSLLVAVKAKGEVLLCVYIYIYV